MAQSGLQRPVTPSKELAEITGSAALPRSQVVSKIWDHIKKNNLQNPQMFEMNKHLSRHLS
jgi:chromatin remodeling complex protein RSC6